MLDFSGLNYWAVLVATLVNVFLGAFWYSPAGFAKIWTKLTKINMMDMPKKDANAALGFTFASAIVQAFLLAVVTHSLHIVTFWHAVVAGIVLWAAFHGAPTISDSLYARRGWKLWWLNTAFYLIVITANTVIFALWR